MILRPQGDYPKATLLVTGARWSLWRPPKQNHSRDFPDISSDIDEFCKHLISSYYVTGSMSGTGTAKMENTWPLFLEDLSLQGEEADT